MKMSNEDSKKEWELTLEVLGAGEAEGDLLESSSESTLDLLIGLAMVWSDGMNSGKEREDR